MPQCTIYFLKNTVNTKVYVGQTWKPLHERWGSGYVGCFHIQRAIEKYGKDKFFYEVLAATSDQNVADYLEESFIKEFDSFCRENGYNLKMGGSRGKCSQETRDKLSKIKKLSGEKPPSRQGVPHTKRSRKAISLAMSNRIVSKETREKLSKAKSGINHPLYGNFILSLDDITEIKNSSLSSRKLAKIYGVGRSTIISIKKRKINV